MLITADNVARLKTGFKSLYDASMLATKVYHSEIAMPITSSSADMTYSWLGRSTQFREWLGERVYQNLKDHGYTIKNKTFENTVSVPRESIEDDTYGVFSPLMSQLGQDAAQHPDLLVFDLLKAGFTTNCYDGQYFFDTDHPVVDANGVVQSISNTGGGAGAPWFLIDASKVIKPIIYQKRRDYKFTSLDKDTDPKAFDRNEYVYGVDGRGNVGYGLWQLAYGSKQTLDEAAATAGRVAMTSLKADGGKPLGIVPNICLVGPTNEAAAKKIFESETNANGATNTLRGLCKVVMVPWLA